MFKHLYILEQTETSARHASFSVIVLSLGETRIPVEIPHTWLYYTGNKQRHVITLYITELHTKCLNTSLLISEKTGKTNVPLRCMWRHLKKAGDK